ncbi:MAG TPA: helix-turn-helix transcriptional regulator [Candidatus Limnocylindrales bacterium]|nr:helix-turn-helix transcriptional regulator [Candidatus Limnocylindrales bacterium]
MLPTITGVDERTTAAMLHGAALARLVPAHGIAVLAAIADTAQRERAHPAVRAEIAYFRAVAHWSADELDRAEELAREAQRNGRDVLAVRALQLRAFIAAVRPTATRFADALALFRNAARAYGRCRERDLDLATIIMQQTAALEQTLRSANVPGTHRTARGSRALPGTAFPALGPSPAFLRLCYDDAWLFALDGDSVTALAKMREADEAAQTPAWHAWTRAASAAISAFFGESGAARDAADHATSLAKSVDWNATTDDERLALLHLAETYAYLGDAGAASIALGRFDEIARPMDPTRILRRRDRDPRFVGWYAHVLGLVRRGEGDPMSAAASLSAAVQAFRSCGYLWREAVSLIELDALPGRSEPGADLDRAISLIREHFPHSFVALRLGPWARAATDPAIGALTPAEREVLRHVLEARSQQEIADLTGRAYNTVRTQVQALHRKLGTSSNAQIIVACARRGIGAPSWRFDQTAAPASMTPTRKAP